MYDDYQSRSNLRRYPKVPINRRIGAFAIDFLSVWFISAFFASNLFFQWLVFLTTWMIFRVIIADKNQGQSLGRWAFDTQVVDPRFERLSELLALLLLAPLLIDCSLAFLDDEYNLAGHDRIANTLMIQTERGFSLDLRLKKIFGQIQRNMRR